MNPADAAIPPAASMWESPPLEPDQPETTGSNWKDFICCGLLGALGATLFAGYLIFRIAIKGEVEISTPAVLVAVGVAGVFGFIVGGIELPRLYNRTNGGGPADSVK